MTFEINLISKDNNKVLTTTDITSRTNIGFSTVEKLDDSLDVGQIVFWDKNPKPYTLFDVIQVKDGTTTIIDMRISGDTVSLISMSPLRYQHSVSLVEHTKILELFTIGLKTFTQPTNGVIRYTLYDVISILRLTTPLETTLNYTGYTLFEMPIGDLNTYLRSVDSPEFTLKNVTLREALSQVCDYVNGIPRLVRAENGTMSLDIDFVSEIKNLIESEDPFININRQIDNDFYATDAESVALNLVNDKLYSGSVEVYPAKDAFMTFRQADTFFQSDFEGSVIPTPKAIYDVSKLVIQTSAIVSNVTARTGKPSTVLNYVARTFEMPLGIIEKKAYDLLETETNANMLEIVGTDIAYNYKNNTIYYNYKQKNLIIGSVLGLFGTQEVLENWVKRAIIYSLIEDGTISSTGGTLGDDFITDTYGVNLKFSVLDSINIEDVLHQIHYVSIPDSTRISIPRQDISEVNKFSTMFTNQQGSVINLEQYANNVQGKINRIGNSDLTVEYRVKDTSSSGYYGIGDYTDDLYIGTVRESVFYNDYIYTKLQLTKNFNKISSFIGVNSAIRQYEIGESLERNLLYKEYVEIDAVASGNGSFDSHLLTYVGKLTYMDTFRPISTLTCVGGGVIENADNSNQTLIGVGSNGGGNSLIFNYKVEDNVSTSYYKKEQDGQEAKEYIPYSDDNGIVSTIGTVLFNNINIINLSQANQSEVYDIADTLPLLKVYGTETNTDERIDNKLVDVEFYVSKDSREAIGQTLQIAQVSKDINRVVLGRFLSLRNKLVSEEPPTDIIIYAYNDGTKYGRTDNLKLKDGYSLALSPSITFDYNNHKFTLSGSYAGYDSYALTDENDNLLLAVNQDKSLNESLTTITFDFENKREGEIYQY